MYSKNSVIPNGSNRIRSIIFFVLVYVSTTLIFALIATVLSFANFSTTWILLFVLLAASVLMVTVYKRYYYAFTYPPVAETKFLNVAANICQCQVTFKRRENFLSFTLDTEAGLKKLASALKISFDNLLFN